MGLLQINNEKVERATGKIFEEAFHKRTKYTSEKEHNFTNHQKNVNQNHKIALHNQYTGVFLSYLFHST